MKRKESAFWRNRQYVIAGTLVVVAAIGMTALYSNRQAEERARQQQEIASQLETEEAGDAVALEEETEVQEASSVVKPEEKQEEKQEEETAQIEEPEPEEVAEDINAGEETAPVANTTQELHFSAENGILWPMEGNVILNYSMDSTVYFATLDQYKYNPAVIISGDVNSKVYSVEKGQVKEIDTSEVTGCTVSVDLGDGYEAVYGQLKELNFEVGDYVEAGHVIGYLSEPTKYFSVEGSNLYFELLKDGVPVDPIEYFE